MGKGIEVKVSKLEGSPLAEHGKFAQAYEYTPPEEELLEKRGRLFVVLDIAANPSFDAALAGKLIWDSLSEDYFSETEEPSIKALERAVLSAKNCLTNLTTRPAEGEEAISPGLEAKGEVELNLAAAVVWSDPATNGVGVFYLARQGKPAFYLRRAGQVQELLPGEEPGSIASIPVEDGDVVILGSQDFGKNFPPTSLPETTFMEEEFQKGEQVPGLAAILLKTKVTPAPSAIGGGAGPREEVKEAPFAVKPSLKIPSVAGILKHLLKRKKGLPLPADKIISPKLIVLGTKGGVKKAVQQVAGEIGKRVSRGRELSLGKRRPEIALPKVILTLALIFLFSVTFTIWRQGQKTRAEEFARLLSSAETAMAEAENLLGLSDEEAKKLWEEANEELTKAAVLKPKDEKLGSLLQQAENLYNRIEKITPVTEEHLFYNLSFQPFAPTQGKSVQGLSLAGRGETIYVAEEKAGATLAINRGTESESPQVEEVTATVKGAREINTRGDFLYLLTGKNFYRYDFKTGKTETPLNFDRYDKVGAFDFYLDRNIYFLVPSENQIYKFQFLEASESYSRALNWLKESVVLEEAVDMAIDGSVWVLLKDGTIVKLFTGKKEPFSLKGLTTALTQPTAIYTHPNLKRLYLADEFTSGGRVVVLEKDGRFVKQFKGEVLTGLVDLWVTDDEKTLFILTQSKVYKIGL